ncbi:MAG: nitroreductase family protein [Acidipropionibacterium acidipropionici]|nr:nitroreductase family protein [Acidipropionibacterium acidipropionici]
MSDIAPVLRGRWSPRSYDPTRTVSPEDVRLLLEAARWAPSAMNRQPWRFIVGIRGDQTRSRLEPFVVGRSDWALDAAALVVNICESDERGIGFYDLGDAVAHMSIQAEEMGLHVRQFGSFDQQGLAAEFGIEAPFVPVTMAAIGVPPAGVGPGVRDRVDVDELLWI